MMKETRRSIRYLESKGMGTLDDVVRPASKDGTELLKLWRELREAMAAREVLESAFQQSKGRNDMHYSYTLLNRVCENITVTIFLPSEDMELTFLSVSFFQVPEDQTNNAMLRVRRCYILFSGLPTSVVEKWPPGRVQKLGAAIRRRV
jgi:hypothetical protein